MAPLQSVKKGWPKRCRLVGVISTPAELGRATAMAHPPDLFELRLDHLVDHEKQLKDQIPRLRRPFILTARAPNEGGAHDLSAKRRRELLLRYLPQASYVDVELRSAKTLAPVLQTAKKGDVRRIISVHDLHGTPNLRILSAKAAAAKRLGADIFKVATRTDTEDDIARLIEFTALSRPALAVCVMGLGRLGRRSRLLLAQAGSCLVYGSVGRPRIAGQPSLSELRSALALFPARIIQ